MSAFWLFKRSYVTLLCLAGFCILLFSVFPSAVMGQGGTAPVRGLSGDLWADKIIGQDDFGEIMPSQITGNRLFNPGGVLVDRSVRPNRLYVYDSNSRVLGFNHLGTVTSGNAADIGKPCTGNGDFPGAICTIQEGRPADLVLGQPALDRGACNGDGNFQHYPDRAPASASTLCGMPEFQISTTEGGSFANMAVDSLGNLYVPDWDNHRVLRYNSPFTTDTIADAVWGQADFSGNDCNRGRGVGFPDDRSFCFRSPTNDGFVGGVGLDAAGNLWVTDNANNRVLRFPFNATLNRPGDVANLVLGQPNFNTWDTGLGLHQMWSPAAVRVTSTGRVYIADSQQNNHGSGRVLYFNPPYTSGMTASGTLNYDFRQPTGLEIDLSGGLWVSDRENHELLLFSNPGTVSKVLFKDVPNSDGVCGGDYQGDGPRVTYEGSTGDYDISNLCGTGGSIGVDSDGNIFATGSDFVQDVWRFPAPIPFPQPGTAHSADARIFKPYQFAEYNSTTTGSLWAARGIAATADQLIIADQSTILFWNDPLTMVNGETADGYVGNPDPRRFDYLANFGRIRQDHAGHLWVLRGGQIQVYQLPLTTGASPFKILLAPLAAAGGGFLNWNDDLLLGGVAPAPDGSWLWVADPRRNRVFRIRDPLTTPQVDIVLGQTSLSGMSCNQGRGQIQPTQTSLCQPGAVALDPQGNLYVSDHALEVEGNHRLLEYDAALFPAEPASVLFAIPASRVIGTGNDFTGPCQTLCGPFEPAFTSTGVMYVGVNSYAGGRFSFAYPTPLLNEDHVLMRDFGSMPYAAAFDEQNNLYVVDKNRGRALFYKLPFPASPPPAIPVLLAPFGMLNNFQPVFRWSPAAGAVRYEIQIDSVNPPASAPFNVTTTTFTPLAALLPGTYYWRVMAFNADNVPAPDWSAVATVTLDPPPGTAPMLNYFTTGTIPLTWNRISWASAYEIQVDTSAAFTAPLTYTATVGADTLQVIVPGLTEGIYYWRVRAKNGSSPGQWSRIDSFTIDL